MSNCVYFVLGSIASGKSVLSRRLVPGVSKIEYLCSDEYKKALFNYPVKGEKSSKKGYRCSDELLFYRIEKLCSEGKDFILEFCPTNRNKLETIKYFFQLYDYKVISFFVGTDNVKTNLNRNHSRINRGEDYIPDKKVKIRYEDALNRILEIMCFSNEMYFIDTSNDEIKTIARMKGRKIEVYEQDCEWFNKNVKKRINNQRSK